MVLTPSAGGIRMSMRGRQTAPWAASCKRLFQRRNGVLHGEDLLDFLVVDDERHNVLTSPAASEKLNRRSAAARA